MTLLLCVFAAIITTIVWYTNDKRKEYNLGFLGLIYWGASIMWFVDAIYEYAQLGAAYFTPAGADMLNDLFLGLSVVALGLVIWFVSVLTKDPDGVVRRTMENK